MLGLPFGCGDFLGSGDHLDLESVLTGIGPTLKNLVEMCCKTLSQLDAVEIKRLVRKTASGARIEPNNDVLIPVMGFRRFDGIRR